MPRLCGYCGGAVYSIILLFNAVASVKLQHVVADLWLRTGEISGYFKNGSSIVLQQLQNKLSFQRKGSGIELTFSLNFKK